MNQIRLAGLAGLIVLLIVFANASLFIVKQASQAIVLQFGDPVHVIEEPGLHVKIPFIQNVVYLDKRVLNFEAPAMELPTLDQKQVVISAYVRYQITDPLTFYRVGKTEANAEGQIRGVLGSGLRKIIGGVQMSEILTAQRSALMSQISDELKQNVAQPYGIKIIDVRLKRVDLPAANSEAIFNRMRTQRAQEARRFRAEGESEARTRRAEADKQHVVILAEARRKAEILKGEGDAKATEIYNAAYGQDAAFFDFYRSMQAMRTGISGNNTTFVGQPDNEFFRFFNSGQAK